MQGDTKKYNQAELGAVREALLAILGGYIPEPHFGLCCNLHSLLRQVHFDGGPNVDGYTFVAEESQDWPHAIRREDGTLPDWFVPGNPVESLWDGENLKMRQNLIQYLLGMVAHHEAMLRGGVALAG